MLHNPLVKIPAEGLGHQFIADVYDCTEGIGDAAFVKKVAQEAAEKGNATLVEEVTHEFSPHGLSCVLVISESHIAIHTWPEYNYVAVDIFTCDLSVDGEAIIAFIKSEFKSARVDVQKLHRGRPLKGQL